MQLTHSRRTDSGKRFKSRGKILNSHISQLCFVLKILARPHLSPGIYLSFDTEYYVLHSGVSLIHSCFLLRSPFFSNIATLHRHDSLLALKLVKKIKRKSSVSGETSVCSDTIEIRQCVAVRFNH